MGDLDEKRGGLAAAKRLGDVSNETTTGSVLTLDDDLKPAWPAPAQPDGGSQPLTLVRLTITPETPNLIVSPGVTLYTPTAGDVFAGPVVLIQTTAWDGAGPTLRWGYPGQLTAYSDSPFPINTVDLTLENAVVGGISVSPASGGPNEPWCFINTSPLVVSVADGDGNDPGSTVGETTIVIPILNAV